MPLGGSDAQEKGGQPGSSTQTAVTTESIFPPHMNLGVAGHQFDFTHVNWMAQSSNGFGYPAHLQSEGHQWQENLTSEPMFNAGLLNQPSSSRY